MRVRRSEPCGRRRRSPQRASGGRAEPRRARLGQVSQHSQVERLALASVPQSIYRWLIFLLARSRGNCAHSIRAARPRTSIAQISRITRALCRVVPRRQSKLKGRTARHICNGRQPTAMRFNDGPAYRQAEPQTAGLSRIEGLEQAVAIFRTEAWTRNPALRPKRRPCRISR